MFQLVPHPEPPFTTLSGDTKGPCVHVGSDLAGRILYVGEQELRQMLKAFGWPAPEAHATVAEERDAAVAHIAELEAELAPLRDDIAALERVVHIRQPKPAAAVEEAS